jgi:hypothetical protein
VEEAAPFRKVMELFHARQAHLEETHAKKLWKEAAHEVEAEADAVKMWV